MDFMCPSPHWGAKNFNKTFDTICMAKLSSLLADFNSLLSSDETSVSKSKKHHKHHSSSSSRAPNPVVGGPFLLQDSLRKSASGFYRFPELETANVPLLLLGFREW